MLRGVKMSNKTVIIFNAPPNAGKDESVNMMYSYFQSGVKLAFKDELYADTTNQRNTALKNHSET